MQAYLNGAYLPLADARIPAQDRGFLLGDGVYEVIRVYNGVPFRLRRHLERLGRSLQGVRISPPEPVESLEAVCRKLIGTLKDAILYLQITRGVAPRTHAFPTTASPTILAYAQEASSPPAGKTFSLKSMPDPRWGRCDLKTICLLPNVLARQEALDAGCDEALFVGEDGTVREGASTNVFVVRGGKLLTHPATNRILGGVTREAVIEAARGRDLSVLEEPATLEGARSADEIFVTGTTSEVLPVLRLDARPVGKGEPGLITKRVQEAYLELVARECGGRLG